MRQANPLLIPTLSLMIAAGADDAKAAFDASVPLLCALNHAQECGPAEGCQALQLEEVDVPPFFRIDINGRTIVPIRAVADDQRRSEIRGAGEVDGKLILQGYEDGIEGERDGLGWTIAIAEDSGHFVLSAAGDYVAFVVFGACTPLDSGSP